MMKFVKTTVVGGITFLIPIVVLVVVVRKAMEITGAIAAPLARLFPVDSVGDLAVVEILAALILVAVCFIAGLAAKTVVARDLVKSLETNVLEKIPAYALLKARTQSVLSPEEIEHMRTVTARFDDAWQLGFQIDRLPEGGVVVFLPGAPDPWSGSVCIMTEDRVRPLDMSVKSAVQLLKRLGRNAGEELEGQAPIG